MAINTSYGRLWYTPLVQILESVFLAMPIRDTPFIGEGWKEK